MFGARLAPARQGARGAPTTLAWHAMHPSFSVSMLTRSLTSLSFALVAACAGATPSADPAPVPARTSPGSQTGGSSPLIQSTWPVRTREHVDAWLHSYALITQDTISDRI